MRDNIWYVIIDVERHILRITNRRVTDYTFSCKNLATATALCDMIMLEDDWSRFE